MCLSQHWCVLSLWYGAETVEAICLTIYSQTGLAATQTKRSATVAIRQALLGNWWLFSGKKTIRALLCTCLWVCVCADGSVCTCRPAHICIGALACLTACLCMYACSVWVSELKGLVISTERVLDKAIPHRWALWGLGSRNLRQHRAQSG